VNNSALKQLVEEIVRQTVAEAKKRQFADPPKMGDIEPTNQPDKKRPGMKKRPKSGMATKQHHTMMHAEAMTVASATSNSSEGFSDEEEEPIRVTKGPVNESHVWMEAIEDDSLVERIANMLQWVGRDTVYKTLKDEGHSTEDIFLAYNAAKILNRDREGGVHESALPPGFTGFDVDDEADDAIPPPDPQYEMFRKLERGDKVRVGKSKLVFIITNNPGDTVKVASIGFYNCNPTTPFMFIKEKAARWTTNRSQEPLELCSWSRYLP
jgi:hypothetical protein